MTSLERLEQIYKTMLEQAIVDFRELLKVDKSKKELYIKLIKEIKDGK